MSEENAELLDSDLLKDAEATAQLPSLALAPVLDELKTVRLPPVTPPPPPMHAVTASLPPIAPPPFPPPARMPSGPESVFIAPEPPPRVQSRPSWIKSLLTTTTSPPTASTSPQGEELMRRRAGFVCVGVSISLGLVAVVVALRGVPDDADLAPVVVASLILGRALVAVGLGALSFGVLRMGERLLARPHAS